MPTVRKSAIALIALLGAGCATLQVSSYLATGADFARYRTYSWAPHVDEMTGDPRLDNNPFVDEQIRAGVHKYLGARGLEKAGSASADLTIHYHLNLTQHVDVGAEARTYSYCENCLPTVYERGTLLIDIVDARANRLVWRGWADGSFDQAIDDQTLMERKIDDAIHKILARLPRLALLARSL